MLFRVCAMTTCDLIQPFPSIPTTDSLQLLPHPKWRGHGGGGLGFLALATIIRAKLATIDGFLQSIVLLRKLLNGVHLVLMDGGRAANDLLRRSLVRGLNKIKKK